jgi:hypothetical protein
MVRSVVQKRQAVTVVGQAVGVCQRSGPFQAYRLGKVCVLDPLQEFQKPLGSVRVVILPVPQNGRHAGLETLPEQAALMLLFTAQDDNAGIRCRLQLCLGDDG